MFSPLFPAASGSCRTWGVDKLQNLDRRFVFAVLLAAIIVSVLFPRPLHVEIEPPVEKAYDTLNALKPGDRVVMSFDYGPSVMGEIHPAALALFRHCLEKGARVVLLTLSNEGPPMIQEAIAKVAEPMGKKENVDYANLGFKWGGQTGSSVIEGLGSDIKAVFPVTREGTPYNQVPLLQGARSLKDFKVLISIASGIPGTDEYIQYANARYHIPIVAAVTKVMAPREFPFLNSGQLSGLCSGLIGGAEYEELINHPGPGIARLLAQSVAHLVIIAFIVFANLIYFAGRKS